MVYATRLTIVRGPRLCSWYPVVYPQYLVKPTSEYDYAIWLCPLRSDDNPANVARTISDDGVWQFISGDPR